MKHGVAIVNGVPTQDLVHGFCDRITDVTVRETIVKLCGFSIQALCPSELIILQTSDAETTYTGRQKLPELVALGAPMAASKYWSTYRRGF